MDSSAVYPRPVLNQLPAYQSGKPPVETPGLIPYKLASNENPWGPSPAAIRAIAAMLGNLHRYPDRPATALRAALGDWHDLDPTRIWAANGSNEVLLQLFQAYGGPGRKLLLSSPGYSAHPLIAKVANTEVVTFDLAEDFTLDVERAVVAVRAHGPTLICLANPNNPVGTPLEHDAIRALHAAAPEALIIADEAYVEFGGTSARALLDELDRLVVTRTFSKAFRLAGLRLGYLLAHDWVIDDIRRVRLPYHLDALTQTAGLVALEQRDEMLAHIDDVISERERIRAGLTVMAGVDAVWPSTGNFLLFRVADGAATFQALLDGGVLVRDFSTLPRLAGCLRVTVGTAGENTTFLNTLSSVLDTQALT